MHTGLGMRKEKQNNRETECLGMKKNTPARLTYVLRPDNFHGTRHFFFFLFLTNILTIHTCIQRMRRMLGDFLFEKGVREHNYYCRQCALDR